MEVFGFNGFALIFGYFWCFGGFESLLRRGSVRRTRGEARGGVCIPGVDPGNYPEAIGL